MADANGSATVSKAVEDIKGKGKAIAEPESHDANMETGDDSSSEEEVEEVSRTSIVTLVPTKLINYFVGSA